MSNTVARGGDCRHSPMRSELDIRSNVDVEDACLISFSFDDGEKVFLLGMAVRARRAATEGGMARGSCCVVRVVSELVFLREEGFRDACGRVVEGMSTGAVRQAFAVVGSADASRVFRRSSAVDFA